MHHHRAVMMLVLVMHHQHYHPTASLPVPEQNTTSSSNSTTQSSSNSSTPSPLALRVVPDLIKSPSDQDSESIIVIGDDDEGYSPPSSSSHSSSSGSSSHKRHTSTPSPEELEERRQAFIKALGGGEDSAPVLVSSLMGLGSLATDVVSLLTSNANETFGPLREARKRARENFPDLGTQLNRYFRNGREYTTRAYRSLVKNFRVKMTNIIRFMLTAVTRLASTVSGLYSVAVSLLDVATRGVQSGARVGSRLLAVGSNITVNTLARGSSTLRSLGESGIVSKPLNQIVTVGQSLAKGLSEDFFDKVEWTQEGVNSKLELAQALAPNFLLRAHERTTTTTSLPPELDAAIEIDSGFGGYQEPSSTTPSSEIYVKYNAGDTVKVGGYAKIDQNDDELALGALAAAASDLMMMHQQQRGGRDTNSTSSGTSTTPTTPKTSTTTTELTDVVPPPQSLLNDIFGLEEQVNELKKNLTQSGIIPDKD